MGDGYMTLAEIEAAYPREWVLLVDMKIGRGTDVRGGRVLYHHPEADPVHERVQSLPAGVDVGVFYTSLDEDDVIDLVSVYFDDQPPQVGVSPQEPEPTASQPIG